MLSLSQIIFGVNDLEAATVRFRAMGFDVLDGGVHPGVGTANRVIPLGAQYLELLGVVSPELARESEYGRSLLRAIADGDRLVRWSLRTDAIDRVAARLGIDRGTAQTDATRRRAADVARRRIVVGARRFDDAVLHAMGPRRAISRTDARASSEWRAAR